MSFLKITTRIQTAPGTAINIRFAITNKATKLPINLSGYQLSFGAKHEANETTVYTIEPISFTGNAQGIIDINITPEQNTLSPGSYLGELIGTGLYVGADIRIQIPINVVGRVLIPQP